MNFNDVRKYVKGMLAKSFTNKTVLDKLADDNGTLTYDGSAIEGGSGLTNVSNTPIGTIISYMGITAPNNYLICDGTIYNITDYKELADFINIQFGSYNYFGGDGTSTFAVPDLRGEFLRGAGENSHENQGSGANVGEHQDATEHPNLAGIGSFGIASLTTDDVYMTSIKNRDKESSDIVKNKYADVVQGGSSYPRTFTSRPTNTSILYCIRYKTDKLTKIKDNYSLEEQAVGTWIDGKPLYQKTVDCGALPNATTKNIAHNIQNMDKMCKIFGVAFSSQYNIPLPYSSRNAVVLFANTNNIIISDYSDCSNYTSYITIQYTKTTD